MIICLLGTEGSGKTYFYRAITGGAAHPTHYSTVAVERENYRYDQQAHLAKRAFRVDVVDTPGRVQLFNVATQVNPELMQADAYILLLRNTVGSKAYNEELSQQLARYLQIRKNTSIPIKIVLSGALSDASRSQADAVESDVKKHPEAAGIRLLGVSVLPNTIDHFFDNDEKRDDYIVKARQSFEHVASAMSAAQPVLKSALSPAQLLQVFTQQTGYGFTQTQRDYLLEKLSNDYAASSVKCRNKQQAIKDALTSTGADAVKNLYAAAQIHTGGKYFTFGTTGAKEHYFPVNHDTSAQAIEAANQIIDSFKPNWQPHQFSAEQRGYLLQKLLYHGDDEAQTAKREAIKTALSGCKVGVIHSYSYSAVVNAASESTSIKGRLGLGYVTGSEVFKARRP